MPDQSYQDYHELHHRDNHMAQKAESALSGGACRRIMFQVGSRHIDESVAIPELTSARRLSAISSPGRAYAFKRSSRTTPRASLKGSFDKTPGLKELYGKVYSGFLFFSGSESRAYSRVDEF